MAAVRIFILAALIAGVLVTVDRPCLAQGEPDTFRVRVAVEGYGLVAGADSVQHAAGTTVTLIPQPHSFWEFHEWRGDIEAGQITAQPLVVLVDRDYDLTAVFTVRVSDAWLLEHFGMVAVDLDDDPDRDGYSTRAEFANGTDPRDGTAIETTLSVHRGWNAIALPLQPLADVTRATVFGADSAKVTAWWGWNAYLQAYLAVQTFGDRQGYWVYALEDLPALTLMGHAIVDSTLRGYAGWNLIPLTTMPAGAMQDWQSGPVWGWDAAKRQYHGVSALPYGPSCAYWVYLSEDIVYPDYVGNTGPTATDDSAVADEDSDAVIIDVLANDQDPDVGNTLTVKDVDAVSSKGAAVTLEADGTLTYNATPSETLNALAEGESASDTFRYTITDGHGGSAFATVTVTVAGRNDTPTANADEAATDADQATDIDVLANDTDPDTSDTLTIQSFDATSERGAAITLNINGTLHYDPTVRSTFEGQSILSDAFSYTLTDGHPGVAVTGTVHVAVDSGVTYITLEGDSISVEGRGAAVEGSVVTLTLARTYSISGTLNDGQIIVDTVAEEVVTLILNGVAITCSDNAPIYVVNAEDTLISLADGTQNYLTDGDVYENGGSDEPDAAVFSKDDLDIAGTGSLTVYANYNNGIGCKDDLDIFGGTISVTAVNHGIRGRDSVEIWDGTVTVSAGGDGIQSNNDEDASEGYVLISGGTLHITAASDGIQAETMLMISGGDVSVSAGGGSNSGASDAGKGLKAAAGITIGAGNTDPASITVDSADDAIHSDGTVTINGGSITLATADDAVHSESAVVITGGQISITTCYEGIDAPAISIDAATIDLVSSDDGISAVSADGTASTVSIGGGTITINAGADGIAAEAQVLITDGAVTVVTAGGSSHTIGGDESAKAVKSDGDLTIQGGTFTISSADDALHSNDSLTIGGGTFRLSCNDDGIHADSTLTINGGDIDITECYEGIESTEITINDGDIRVVSSDDGINIASGADGSGGTGGPGWPPGGGGGGGNGHLYINGGRIAVYAVGDGVDVNGSMTVTAGTIIVHGPTVRNNAPLDYDGTFVMSGGFLIAVGSSAMAQAPSTTSSQEVLFGVYGVSYSPVTQAAGTMLHIETTTGEEILTFVPAKNYQCFVLCSPQLEAGTTYVVYSGGSSTGTVADGLYSGGTYTSGTVFGRLTL